MRLYTMGNNSVLHYRTKSHIPIVWNKSLFYYNLDASLCGWILKYIENLLKNCIFRDVSAKVSVRHRNYSVVGS